MNKKELEEELDGDGPEEYTSLILDEIDIKELSLEYGQYLDTFKNLVRLSMNNT